MDMYPQYKSALGYQIGEDGVDSYGVNHNGFSTRDELEYQVARQQRENQLIQNYNNQGITQDYPQQGTEFWGSNTGNNYGFGSSNISGNIENVVNQLNNKGMSYNNQYSNTGQPYNNTVLQTPTPWSNGYQQQMQTPTPWSGGHVATPNTYNSQNLPNSSYQDMMPNAGRQQKRLNMENDLLMNEMDVLYGANRTLNGMSFGGLDWMGNKFGFDSQMKGYLDLKDEQSRKLAQTAGRFAELGGSALTGGALAKAGYNQANMAYNGYKIGKKYDELLENPYQGSGSDIIARMRNHNGEPVVLQRGEAMPGENGNVVVYGKDLKRALGTERNYGLDKAIYRHEVSRADIQRIPRIIQQKPVETNNYGQNVYLVRSKNGAFRVVTSPKDDENIISTMYYLTK